MTDAELESIEHKPKLLDIPRLILEVRRLKHEARKATQAEKLIRDTQRDAVRTAYHEGVMDARSEFKGLLEVSDNPSDKRLIEVLFPSA